MPVYSIHLLARRCLKVWKPNHSPMARSQLIYTSDYLKTAISLAIVTAVYLFTNTMMVFWNLSSYVLVLLAFLEFVVWNGGVVLGKLVCPEFIYNNPYLHANILTR